MAMPVIPIVFEADLGPAGRLKINVQDLTISCDKACSPDGVHLACRECCTNHVQAVRGLLANGELDPALKAFLTLFLRAFDDPPDAPRPELVGFCKDGKCICQLKMDA
jgi:hypothetical protein